MDELDERILLELKIHDEMSFTELLEKTKTTKPTLTKKLKILEKGEFIIRENKHGKKKKPLYFLNIDKRIADILKKDHKARNDVEKYMAELSSMESSEMTARSSIIIKGLLKIYLRNTFSLLSSIVITEDPNNILKVEVDKCENTLRLVKNLLLAIKQRSPDHALVLSEIIDEDLKKELDKEINQ